jgi:hypothetical protein
MTGTLTTVVASLAYGRHPSRVVSSVQILVSLLVGAAVATLLIRHAVLLVPLLQVVPVGIAVVAGVLMRRATS